MPEYPQSIKFETPDGEGEANKPKQGARWHVQVPTGDFHWYGSIPEIKSEIRRRVEPQEVTFS